MDQPTVTVDQGKLLGSILTNLDNEPFFAFKGIPFARPPLGRLRFRAPLPPIPWNGTWDATKDSQMAYQCNIFTQEFEGSEDCLYLNVYTKHLPKDNEDDVLKPVMFYIHEGGFTRGSGISSMKNPEHFMIEDIVLVVPNYRLGLFGFLSLENPTLKVPGNAGLKDIVMALKWVQRNIEQFCGDPKNVTIFGVSAGGAATHLMVLSPMAKNLFHKAIIQSGCAFSNFAMSRYFNREAWRKAGIKENNPKDVLKYLRSISKDELLKIQNKVENNEISCWRFFGPIVENTFLEPSILSKNPLKLLRSGEYNQVPMIIGITNQEGIVCAVHTLISSEDRTFVDISTHIPSMLTYQNYPKITKEMRITVKKIKKLYFGDKDITTNREAVYELFGDSGFNMLTFATIKNHLPTAQYPIYFYEFCFDTTLNMFKAVFKAGHIPGACHADDCFYMFKTTPVPIQPGSPEDKGVRTIVKLWANFAHHGNPTPNLNDFNVIWKPIKKTTVDTKNFNVFNIDQELYMKRNTYTKKINFWREIYELFHYDNFL